MFANNWLSETITEAVLAETFYNLLSSVHFGLTQFRLVFGGVDSSTESVSVSSIEGSLKDSVSVSSTE